jgi:hypothetical protein
VQGAISTLHSCQDSTQINIFINLKQIVSQDLNMNCT